MHKYEKYKIFQLFIKIDKYENIKSFELFEL